MFHPTRGGTRGGQDQFKWEDVKEDKHRENYLGNSLHAAVGRWQKGRDLTWYAKAGDKDGDVAILQASKKAEMQGIKDAEAEAMAEALGYKTKRKTGGNVTDKELQSAINKTDNGVQDELDEQMKESTTIAGLGFKSRTQRTYAHQQVEGRSQQPLTSSNTIPVVPLIPQALAASSDSTKNSVSSERTLRQGDAGENDSEKRRKRRRSSRSVSPARKSRHDRDCEGKELGRTGTKNRERPRSIERERRGHGSTRRHTREGQSHRDRHRSRSKSKSRRRSRSRSRSRSQGRERHSLDRDRRDTWRDRDRRPEEERDPQSDRRRRRV